jgi:beta-fructofuranosidase
MKLNKLQQKIISVLEPLPVENKHKPSASIIEQGQIRIGETVAGILRSLRRGQPMNWDPWILKDGNVYRLFYLRGLAEQTPWWIVSKMCGAISTDLIHWQDIGTILEPEPANDWEAGRIFAGCTYKENGIYYLFYSAAGNEHHEAIGLATSSDGLHFSRYSNNYLLKPDDNDPWYGLWDCTGHFHWRDPYIFKDDTGKYYMFICARAKAPGNFSGCIGLAVADKIEGPYKILPPAVKVPVDAAEEWFYYHMERPQVIYKDGKYHLFFSSFKMYMNPKWLQKIDSKRVTNSSLYWYVSDTMEGPYLPVNNDDFIVKGSETTGMYGTNFLQVSTDPEEWIAYGWYHRLHALAVSQAFRVGWKNTWNLDSLKISLTSTGLK